MDRDRSGTLDVSGAFASRMRPIRPKTLKNFLMLYYLAYIADSKQRDGLPEFKRERRPRVYPGLFFIRRHFSCSKGKAQDYLRAVEITHDIFLKREIENRGFAVRVDKNDYAKLLKKVAWNFSQVAEILGVRRKRPDKLQEAR